MIFVALIHLETPMLLPTPTHILLFIALICLPSITLAQRDAPLGQSTITGRVVYADIGRGVRRASVSLHKNLNHPPVRTTPTNQRGEFRFTEVAAGSYFVVAQSPGILSPLSTLAFTEFGLATSAAEQTQVTVDGKNEKRCELRVARAGTIKGTMTYVDKEPVVSSRVLLFRRKDGTVTPLFPPPIFTNDRGMYRIDGLPDGEYFVGVVVGKTAADNSRPQGLPALANAYYPSVGSLAEAKAVQVRAGAEVNGIDITLGDGELRRISGVVKSRPTGEPLKDVALTLRRKEDTASDVSLTHLFRTITPANSRGDDTMMRDMGLMMMAAPPSVETKEQGEWQFEDLSPGTYIITAYTSLKNLDKPAKTEESADSRASSSDLLSDQSFVGRQVEVTIDEEDRSDVTIELSPGGRILGVVTAEDGSEVSPIPITVSQDSKPDSLLNSPQFSKPDGTFLLEGISAGEARLDVEFFRDDDLYLKSITLGGQDLMREPLRVTEGGEVAGVQITVGKGLATLTGRVQFKEDGSAASGAGVLIIKTDARLWRSSSSRYFTNTDLAGAFTLTCAPGDYLVFTWPAGSQPVQPIRDFVQSQASAARTVSLRSKEEKQIELTVTRPRK